jgi:hypothetical protein
VADLSGRIVAGHSVRPDDLFLDRRFRTATELERALDELRDNARSWLGSRSRIFFAIAKPGEPSFLCRTMRADRLGRVRITLGWPWPNANNLISSCSVLGVRRQLKRRAVRQ